jgi:DNA polymerase III subunit chi
MQIVGYHHSISPLEKVLPKLLEKVLASGQKAVVMISSEEQLKTIDTFLWTYSKSELVPHGGIEDGNALLQPVWLTCIEENPNHATVLVIIGNLRPSHILTFEKVLILNSEWTSDITEWASSKGELTVWSEKLVGGWEKQI